MLHYIFYVITSNRVLLIYKLVATCTILLNSFKKKEKKNVEIYNFNFNVCK